MTLENKMIEGKEYKLKKAIITPEETIPAGTVFHFFSGIGEAIDYDYRIAKESVKDFDEWFEEVSEPPKRWRAERGGEYYIVSNYGEAVSPIERRDSYDDYHWNIGNYFKTEQGAKNYISYLKAKQRLKDSAGGFVPSTNDKIFTIVNLGDELVPWSVFFTPGAIHFETEEAALNSLEEYEEDWITVLRYETSGE